MKQLIRKTLLALIGGVMCNAAWADVVVPTPVYFNDFSFATNGSDGIEIVGNGVFENDADARFGRIFHNDPTLTKAIRTNYLKLPADVLSHSGTSKEMTIGFWVNMKDAADFYWSPLFTAYPNDTKAADADSPWPIFTCLARKVVALNCWGYCDLGDTYNDKGANAVTSAWLDDKEWHYYTITLTSTTIKVYIDGVVENSWTVDGTTAGQVINGVFEAGAAYENVNGLKYICLGGNQSNNLGDPDPAFGFDDFAVYNVALSKAQIDQIRANKLNRTVTGTKIGNIDGSTEYLAASSTQKTLYPGDSYHYRFINYNNGSNNWNNWILPVYNTSDTRVITVRTDNYEDMAGANTGCTSNFNWTNFPGNVNGATVDMTVTFTVDKKFNMSSTINTVNGSTWNYSYTNDYTGSAIDLTSNNYIKVALSVSRSWIDILSEEYSALGITVPVINWGTYVSANNLDFSQAQDGLSAYAITGRSGSVITKEAVTGIVPAGTPLLVSGTANASYTVPVATSAGSAPVGNLLQAGDGSAVGYVEGKTRYVLSADGSTPVFLKLAKGGSSATVPAGKAYLEFDGDVSARELTFDFDSETTAISELTNTNLTNYTNEYFNLAGQRVANPTKGLYIVNGKKVVVK